MIQYRLATRDDNGELIRLTAASGMAGETAIRIDRRPDFFGLLDMRGDTKVFIALDGKTVVGSLCVSMQEVYVGGKIYPVQYIGDFKVSEAYRNKGVGLRLCNEMANYVISIGSDLAFLNVSKGNTKPVSFFRNRPGVPDFDNIGVFNIHQFIGKRSAAFHPVYKIEPAEISEELVNYFDKEYRKYELGALITKEKIVGSKVYVIRYKKDIIAAMCLMDTMEVKQNVVTKLSAKMRYLLNVVNALSRVAGLSRMPVLNEPVRMLYIRYIAVNDHEPLLIKLLISYARNIAYERSYSFVSIGLHEKDPLNKRLPGLLKLTFNSVGMLLSIKDNRSLVSQVKKGVPFEDYSLV